MLHLEVILPVSYMTLKVFPGKYGKLKYAVDFLGWNRQDFYFSAFSSPIDSVWF